MSVIITTDYKLNQVAGQTYGMCRCNWSAPFDRYDFEKGFVLPNPSKARVAAQALIWALESIRGADFLNPKQDTVIVATKSKWLYELITLRAGKAIASGRWPKSTVSIKTLATRCYTLIEMLNAEKKDFITLVYIEPEEGDDAIVDLDENRTEDGFDMHGLVQKGTSQTEIDKAFQKTRMNGVAAEKLLGSGARCYRPGKKT